MNRLLIGALLILVFSSLLAVWWKNGISAVNLQDKRATIFVIEKGQGVREIANKLKNEDLIKDPVVFFLLVKKLGLDGKIQAGDFRLSPSMTASEIAQILTHGTLDIWVTIPEGKRAEEIADILKIKIPSYDESWRTLLAQNEGFLFPDTYLIPKDASSDIVLSLMKNNFEKKFSSIPNAPSDPAKRKKVVIIASIVEREAKFSEDRSLVASVIFNRLTIGMKLDIDATVQYSLGFQENQKTWWKRGLTRADLKLDSSYNTYINAGLPPTPISNPGIDVLQAVINPAKTDYLYYLSDKLGHNHYAKTLEEHNANIRRYDL